MSLMLMGGLACSSSTSVLSSTEVMQPTTEAPAEPATTVGTDPSANLISTEADSGASDGDAVGVSDTAEVARFAEETQATVVLAQRDENTAMVWHDGSVVDIPAPDNALVWSDGDFIYRALIEQDGVVDLGLIYRAFTLDGEPVCESSDRIYHATRRSDGSFVMAVEPAEVREEPWDGIGEYAVPLDAVDCASGSRQPIEPVLVYSGEGEIRFTVRRTGRTFTGFGDAEGNADIENEQGISINGEDYAGYHTFNRDASIVAYGDMSINGPHYSPIVVGRDTVSGEQLWRSEFEIDFSELYFVGDRVLVGFIDDFDRRMGAGGTRNLDRVVMLDAGTGTQVDEVDVGFGLLFVG
ncbi:MAG: hypothetical protein ACRBK7_23625 [Acidimicrobiales bacterium]